MEQKKKYKIKCDDCQQIAFINFKPDGVRSVFCFRCLTERRKSGIPIIN